MPLKLMYITKRPEIAEIAIKAGVDIIFLDMEYIGKDIRQGGMDTVKNHHTASDIATVRDVIDSNGGRTKLLARVNPIHEDSENEINGAIERGADIVMLPMWKSVDEVKQFINFVGKRAKVCLLLETKEAAEIIDDVLELDGIDCIHIGLNDLHLSYKMKFMFQPLTEGIVDTLAEKIKLKGMDFGFGGIAKLHEGAIPAERILGEHIRLKSDMVILSRSFCNQDGEKTLSKIKEEFVSGVTDLRNEELIIRAASEEYLAENHLNIINAVNKIVSGGC